MTTCTQRCPKKNTFSFPRTCRTLSRNRFMRAATLPEMRTHRSGCGIWGCGEWIAWSGARSSRGSCQTTKSQILGYCTYGQMKLLSARDIRSTEPIHLLCHTDIPTSFARYPVPTPYPSLLSIVFYQSFKITQDHVIGVLYNISGEARLAQIVFVV